MKTFGHGLIVGKFCPLHRGHQYLLERAQHECERLIILSYTKPELPGCEPARRERWLADLYPEATRLVLDDMRLAAECRQRSLPVTVVPDNSASDDTHRQFVAWLLKHLLETTVDVVFTSEAYGEGFAAVLSREQQADGGPAVRHVMVDAERHAVPVSGTALRADIHGLRRHLAPGVYKDFIRRVAFLGGESTGKSVLAQQLASRLQTVHAAEYGRELWEAKQGVLIKNDMIHIAQTQMAREDSLAPTAVQYLFCDTTPLTTALYSQALFGEVSEELNVLARRTYDRVFLCAPDVPFVQDGTRRDEAFRRWQHEWYVRELHAGGVAYRLLTGSWETRMSTVLSELAVGA
ncbi:AAA family ATPase [Dyella sp. GSA-30]|uniref:AAA family ATPase n=1 Tax=Dyella sp. GSA-30 TaxID=2994496 RepID=UPI002491FAC3|nr:AAA family ATPase [Dyella sp. GSA-30]BDU21741.1 hypothetical protein DYGSA30_31980 [Dyella sp. GSA-30]